MGISSYISDLFFNLDHSGAKVMQKDKFSHFDETQMTEQARWFAEAIYAIGGPDLDPTSLLTDFYKRL